MKITERFRGVEGSQPTENEKPIQADTFEKKKDPTPGFHIAPKDAFEDLPHVPGGGLDDQLRGFIQDLVNDARESSAPKISSEVKKYKGPDSIELPKIESKVEKYKGPDSMQRPQPESEVEKYKGPDSLPGEPKIESRVDKYRGPESLNRSDFQIIADALDDLPSFPTPDDADVLDFVRDVFDDASGSSDSNKSIIESEASKYKGPDSIDLASDATSKESERSGRTSRRSNERSSTNDALLRLQIESQLKK